MKKIILCPTDFSECAQEAIHYASRLAVTIDAEIRLMNVLRVPVIDAYSPADVLKSMMDSQKEMASLKMKELKEEMERTHDCAYRIDIEFGFAAELIKKRAKEINASLIVMGTHGESNAINKFLGTISYETAKGSEVPVLVVPMGTHFESIDRVAIAWDHEMELDDQLSEIYKITTDRSPQIDILTIVPEGTGTDEVCVLTKEGGVCILEVRSEKVAPAIHQYVKDNDVDLLAVKRHQRNFFENIFHKSTTKDVLGKSPIPVLVFNE